MGSDGSRRQVQEGGSYPAGLRALGTGAAALTLAAVAANVVWFARHGVGPLELLAIAGPLWLGVAAVIGAAALAAWLLGRVLSARDRDRQTPQGPTT